MSTKYIISGALLASIIMLGVYLITNYNDSLRAEGGAVVVKKIDDSTNDFKEKEHDNVTKNNAVIDDKSDDDINSMFDNIPAKVRDQGTVSGGVGGTTDVSQGQGFDQEDEYRTQEGVVEEPTEPNQLLENVCPPLIWYDTLGWVPNPYCSD